MTTHTPRHARRLSLTSLRRGSKRTYPEPAPQPGDPAWGPTWTPLPLDATEVSEQARRELAAISKAGQDVWAGTRDTDRSL